MDCKQFQQQTLVDAQDENSQKTKLWIDDLIGKGEALHCPSCQVLLLKKWGCDWVRCTYCRTEICWVTRQLRWGPNVSCLCCLLLVGWLFFYRSVDG